LATAFAAGVTKAALLTVGQKILLKIKNKAPSKRAE
jgi:hypothetical protein